jgi:hypothetical protein
MMRDLSSWWHLHALWSRFLSRSPVHQTQHVHDSRRLMIRCCVAGKHSPSYGATACTNRDPGKSSATVGVTAASTCTDCGGKRDLPARTQESALRPRRSQRCHRLHRLCRRQAQGLRRSHHGVQGLRRSHHGAWVHPFIQPPWLIIY